MNVQDQSEIRELKADEIDEISGAANWGPIEFSFFGFLDCVFYGKNGANIVRCSE